MRATHGAGTQGMGRHRKAWEGMGRHGKAWEGMGRHGKAWGQKAWGQKAWHDMGTHDMGTRMTWGQAFYLEPGRNRLFGTHLVRSSGSVARRSTPRQVSMPLGTNRSAAGTHFRHASLHVPPWSRRHDRDFLVKTLNTLCPPHFSRAAHSAPVALPSRHSSDHVRRRALPIRLHA